MCLSEKCHWESSTNSPFGFGHCSKWMYNAWVGMRWQNVLRPRIEWCCCFLFQKCSPADLQKVCVCFKVELWGSAQIESSACLNTTHLAPFPCLQWKWTHIETSLIQGLTLCVLTLSQSRLRTALPYLWREEAMVVLSCKPQTVPCHQPRYTSSSWWSIQCDVV